MASSITQSHLTPQVVAAWATNIMPIVIQDVWAALWQRADAAKVMVQYLTKEEIKQVMEPLARSHQDVYRWAKLATFWPAGERRLDRSVQWHYTEMRKREREAKAEGDRTT